MMHIMEKTGHMYTWHVDKNLKEVDVNYIGNNGLDRIQADGSELQVVLNLFGETIPRTNERVQVWSGDLAMTILRTLVLKYA